MREARAVLLASIILITQTRGYSRSKHLQARNAESVDIAHALVPELERLVDKQFRPYLSLLLRSRSPSLKDDESASEIVDIKRQTAACPRSEDGRRELVCPSLREKRHVCIDDHQLCDGHSQCPQGEDEHPLICMFYSAIRTNLNILVTRLITIRRGSRI